MKGWKRYLAVLMAGSTGVSLAACGGSAGEKNSSEKDGDKALPVSIWDNNRLAEEN